jgi:hypothetical protein
VHASSSKARVYADTGHASGGLQAAATRLDTEQSLLMGEQQGRFLA